MSYASGFMVGTSIGKAVYDLFHNKKREAAPLPVRLRCKEERQLMCRALPAYPRSRAVVATGLHPLSVMQGWPNSWKRKSVS